jgi:hypothetical protein
MSISAIELEKINPSDFLGMDIVFIDKILIFASYQMDGPLGVSKEVK